MNEPPRSDRPEAVAVMVGHVQEIEPLLPRGTHVVRVAAGSVPDLAAQPALVVLDAMECAPSDLATTRGTPLLNGAPALLVAADDGLLETLRANDAIFPPFSKRDARSVRALIELGLARAALAQRRTFERAVLDAVGAGIVMAEPRGRVTFFNRTAAEILRRGEPDVDVRTLLDLPGSPESMLGGLSESHRTQTIRIDDRDVELGLAIHRVDRAGGEAMGYFFLLSGGQDENLEVEHTRLERLAAMGTMVAGFAHEIRNPMASLRSLAEALGEELAEKHVALPHVDRMLQVLERVEGLVRTSLLFGRPSPPRKAAHEPATIAQNAITALAPRARAFGEELRVDFASSLPNIFVDDGQLVQVLVILLNNAIDATGSPQRVHLRARLDVGTIEHRASRKSEPPKALVRFEVRDDGPGIAPNILSHIFDPFFTTKAQGTGLGLSIAQQLVTENRARLEVTSAAGGPTTFSVLVPLAATPTNERR